MALPKIDTPRYEMKIPSTGKTVTYRPYLVKEEKILMMAIESNDEQQMIRAAKDVISECVEGDFEVSKLAMFDLEYIFTMLRSKSVGETATVGVKCNSCDTKNDIDVNLEDVRVDVPSDSSNSVIMLTDKIGVKMKYPSVDSLTNVENLNAENSKNIDVLFDMLISCIDKIYSGEEVYEASQQSKQELTEFVESLSTKQFSEMQKFIESIPVATLDINFKCLSCETDNKIEVKGLGNFFS